RCRTGSLEARGAAQAVATQRRRRRHRLHAQALASFTRFLDDARICLTNNAAERALRGLALGRKAWLFAGSDRGGQRAAFIYGLIVTAKLNDIDPQAWARRRAGPHRRPSRQPPRRTGIYSTPGSLRFRGLHRMFTTFRDCGGYLLRAMAAYSIGG